MSRLILITPVWVALALECSRSTNPVKKETDYDPYTNLPVFIIDDSLRWKPLPGVDGSRVFISSRLVAEAHLREHIGHYIRNQLLGETTHHELDYRGRWRHEKPVFFKLPDEDKFVAENSKIICKVIYYLYSHKYYNLREKYGYQADILLEDRRLGIELNRTITKLKKEGSYYERFPALSD